MKLALVSAAAVAAAFIAAAPASATAYALGNITAPTTRLIDRTANGSSGLIRADGQNTDTFTFTLTNATAIAVSSLTNSSVNGSGVFDFTSVQITGGSLVNPATYTIDPRDNFGSETAKLGPTTLLAGNYTLTVVGTVTGQPATYGGNITFAAAAVPEPATWGLMVLGFGAIGGALRTSRRKVVFA